MAASSARQFNRAIQAAQLAVDNRRTMHIALGNNAGMGGSVITDSFRRLIRNATLYVDGELVLDKGTLVISAGPDSR
jgi:hypothetical protein